DRPEPTDPSAPQILDHVREEAARVAREREVDRAAVLLRKERLPARVEWAGIPEARPHMHQIGAGDDHHATPPALDDAPERQDERLRDGVARRIAPRRLGVAEPTEDRHDRRRAGSDDVAEEQRLELDRVLLLVEVLIFVHVEAARLAKFAD